MTLFFLYMVHATTWTMVHSKICPHSRSWSDLYMYIQLTNYVNVNKPKLYNISTTTLQVIKYKP